MLYCLFEFVQWQNQTETLETPELLWQTEREYPVICRCLSSNGISLY